MLHACSLSRLYTCHIIAHTHTSNAMAQYVVERVWQGEHNTPRKWTYFFLGVRRIPSVAMFEYNVEHIQSIPWVAESDQEADFTWHVQTVDDHGAVFDGDPYVKYDTDENAWDGCHYHTYTHDELIFRVGDVFGVTAHGNLYREYNTTKARYDANKAKWEWTAWKQRVDRWVSIREHPRQTPLDAILAFTSYHHFESFPAIDRAFAYYLTCIPHTLSHVRSASNRLMIEHRGVHRNRRTWNILNRYLEPRTTLHLSGFARHMDKRTPRWPKELTTIIASFLTPAVSHRQPMSLTKIDPM